MSRRFKNRHHRVQAQPDALPTPPVVLDDSNSTRDVWTGLRTANVLNARRYQQAGVDVEELAGGELQCYAENLADAVASAAAAPAAGAGASTTSSGSASAAPPAPAATSAGTGTAAAQ